MSCDFLEIFIRLIEEQQSGFCLFPCEDIACILKRVSFQLPLRPLYQHADQTMKTVVVHSLGLGDEQVDTNG